MDSIVDVIGVALAMDSLDVEKIYSSPVPLGSGTVRCDHGIYPVPAPATLEMMRGLPIAPTPYAMEMTTPTGAGIISGIVDEFAKGYPPMIVESIGYGAGTRDLPNQPNVLRVVIGKADPFIHKYQVYPAAIQAAPEAHTHHHHEHSHDHGHSHSHDHHHDHDHSHSHDHHHDHDHSHSHDHHHDRGHSHSHDHHHNHDHSHSHDHRHDHDHLHSHEQHHDHDHSHSHDHHHGHDHDHSETNAHSGGTHTPLKQ
ncbi:nickel insertion protein [Paenibacillus sp. TAB 01]|uniref:nickel insertion protein n=1 Tax=Paenibacillus sp. TAB 01 TaxID=3368988 RepID=UPI003753AC59